jgi:predicted MFS family arabinose efflux permease
VRANVGNSVGAWLGGMTLAAGLGFTSPIWVGAALTAGDRQRWIPRPPRI